MVSVDQIMLERQLLTIAHAHTNDRANAVLAGSLFIPALVSDIPLLNSTSAANATIGQLVLSKFLFFDMYYAMFVSFNASTNEITYLSLRVATRETTLKTAKDGLYLLNKYVPDVEIKDMTVLAQLFADGNLLDQPPSTTINLERGVKKLMTRVKRVTPEEHRRQQQLHEKYHQQRESESRDL
jgi:hypothetical protein